MLAYTMNVSPYFKTRADIRGAIEGLTRTWETGFRKVILQLDSKEPISLLTRTLHYSIVQLYIDKFITLFKQWKMKIGLTKTNIDTIREITTHLYKNLFTSFVSV
ncbi:hypothetical protein LINPERHAP1_LOCUS25132 [Linum perenne]